MAEPTLEFLGEQMQRMLDGQREMRRDIAALRDRGDLLARALEAARQGLEVKIELARVDLLEAITVETRSEAVGTRTRIEQELDALRGQIDALAHRLEAVEKA